MKNLLFITLAAITAISSFSYADSNDGAFGAASPQPVPVEDDSDLGPESININWKRIEKLESVLYRENNPDARCVKFSNEKVSINRTTTGVANIRLSIAYFDILDKPIGVRNIKIWFSSLNFPGPDSLVRDILAHATVVMRANNYLNQFKRVNLPADYLPQCQSN